MPWLDGCTPYHAQARTHTETTSCMGLVPATGSITPLLVLRPAFPAAWQKPLNLLLPSCPSPNLPLHLHALNPLSFGPGSQPITLTQATVTLATIAFAAAVGVRSLHSAQPMKFHEHMPASAAAVFQPADAHAGGAFNLLHNKKQDYLSTLCAYVQSSTLPGSLC